MQAVRVTIFPGGANAPLYLGLARGWFTDAGLDVSVHEVTSSREQLSAWERAEADVMHTSPDHLIRARRPHEPVIVRRDGFGEISAVLRDGDPGEARWAVDDPRSGFAFVLRALLEDECGVVLESERMIPVGGTRERFAALSAEDPIADGTALHPPFDALADEAGMRRLAGHLDCLPELATLVTVVRRSEADDDGIRAYLEITDRAVEELRAGGREAISGALAGHGMPKRLADAGAAGLSGPAGFAIGREPELSSLAEVAALRKRFDTGWSQLLELEELLL